RLQQGVQSGLQAWRYLESTSDVPRSDHAMYAGEIFRVAPGKPMPPWDYGCQCSWEWVFPHELEAMGIEVNDLPVFDPPPPASGYHWSASDYVAMKRSHAETQTLDRGGQGQRRGGEVEKCEGGKVGKWEGGNAARAAGRAACGLTAKGQTIMRYAGQIVVCDAVPAPLVPAEVLLVPWGRVQRKDGEGFLLDADGARQVIEAYRAGGTDLVIDYEHQSMGGRFASPDGTAAAAGWIKALRVAPGEGIYGQVEWTARGSRLLAAKEYRYLSPVVLCEEDLSKARRVIELLSAGLTNEPAIVGFPALVNTRTGSTVETPESQIGETQMDIAAMLRDLVEFVKDADKDAIIAKIQEIAVQIGTGETGPIEGGAAIEVLAEAASEELKGAGGEEVASSLKAKDYAGAAKHLKLAINRVKHPVGMVAKTEYEALGKRVGELEATLAERDLDQLIQVNSAKLTPAETDSFKKLYAKDPAFAREWIAGQPVKVANAAKASAGAAPGGDRMTLINSARAQYREGADWGGRSERDFVNGTLLAKGQKGVSEDEAGKLGLAA
ncbi:MAG TPA: phage protease, partial [Phycisphaerae bacterium]|nr:phage protease [Phycisphaerae bacterium]